MFPDLRLSDASRSPLPPFAHPAEIVAEIARGRPVILADRTDRENEGDLIIAADCVTPAVIALMAREARGLICLALHADIADSLGLEPLAKCGHGFRDTPFTRSIEASSGITTGISAADRASTIAAALSGRGPAAICSPGHVFPLVAKRGGLAVRDGHTEASVTLAELAGRQPAAVICEIMNDDGTMARRDICTALPCATGF